MTYFNEASRSTGRRLQSHLAFQGTVKKSPVRVALALLFSAATALCPLSSFAQTSTYTQTNIVSDGSVSANKTDPHLINPWGIAIGKDFWIDSPTSGLSLIDDSQGSQQFTVAVPPALTTSAAGEPTGVVFNGDTTVFQIPSNTAAQFIFATLDGTIAAWNSSLTAAVTVVNNSSAKAVYTGIAIDTNATGSFVLAANQITGGGIDVFDKNFAPAHLAGSFTDPTLPTGFSPFSVHILAGNVYVDYTEVNPATGKRVVGAGLGFVDVYDVNGNFLQRAISAGNLNAPWGMAIAPAGFGSFSGDLLVGNFGDGTINAFDPSSFALKGQLQDADGNAITNSGLWEIVFGAKNVGDPNTLFFSAGINATKGGLFGEISLSGPPVGAPDFTFQSATTALTVANGKSGNVTASLTGINGFSGPVTFTCSGLPTGDACTFNPATVSISGTTATSVAVSISTVSTAGSTMAQLGQHKAGYGLALAFMGPLGMLALFGIRRRSMILRGTALAFALVLMSAGVIGCGSSNKDQSLPPPAAPVTTNITINATSGSTTHTIPVALTVD